MASFSVVLLMLHIKIALRHVSVFGKQRVCERREGGCPDTHELPPQLGLDTLGLRLCRVDSIAKGPQVVVNRQALPHVEGAGAEVAEGGVLHRCAELGVPGGVRAVILQPPGLPWGAEGHATPSEPRAIPPAHQWGCPVESPDPLCPSCTHCHAVGYRCCRTHCPEGVRRHVPATSPCVPLGPTCPKQHPLLPPCPASCTHSPQPLLGRNWSNTVKHNEDSARVRASRHYRSINIITQNNQQTKILILKKFLLFTFNRVIPFKRVIYKEIKNFTHSSSPQVK